MTMKKTVLTIGLTLLLAGFSMAQINNWQNLKSLEDDQRVVIVTMQNKTVKARFQAADDDKLSLTKGGKPVVLSKADVKRVYLGKKKASHFGGLVGGIGGFFVGGVIAAAIYNSGSRQGDGLEGLAGAVPGAIGGALLGRQVGGGTKQSHLIYSTY
jgi:hypothetical protein